MLKLSIQSVKRDILIIVCCSGVTAQAQDTVLVNEVRLHSSIIRQSLLRSTASAAVIDSSTIQINGTTSFVPVLNTVAGVRMEERSPGSYRISIRGSLLRSPFGVRNVKCYLGDFPLTDAGGNTYVNSLGLNAIQSIEILKGPDGSLFGANSGGVVILDPFISRIGTTFDLGGGSYGTAKAAVTHGMKIGKHDLQLNGNYQGSEGYRDNSSLSRIYMQASDRWRYNHRNEMKFFMFYSNLAYETPGGLTVAQYDSAPRQSRPRTATLPGAAEQKAGVKNRTFFGGISHDWQISEILQNTSAVFASTVDFKNPFITNYETRQEDTWGGRSFFRLHSRVNNEHKISWQYFIGVEGQQTKSTISNFKNLNGEKANLLAAGKIISSQYFAFNRFSVEYAKRLTLEVGASANYYRYRFRDSASLSKKFRPEWMPRAAISWLAARGINFRASGSKGYSPPTTAEIRPSDNNIYSGLAAEKGWNLEAGVRYSSRSNNVWIDVSLYQFNLRDAILRQQNISGEEFFVNAGSTRQKGFELQLGWAVIDSTRHGEQFFRDLRLRSAVTLNHFRFDDYKAAGGNFSGNRLTGVPDKTIISGISLTLKQGINFFIEHNYTARLPLNDANSVYAEAYSIFKCRLGLPMRVKNSQIELYAIVENIGNVKYSLGNDLNAAGNRFYNAAAGRNYFAGLLFRK